MKNIYCKFYEQAGRCYPEDEIIYSSLSGIIRRKWVTNKLNKIPAGNLLDCGCNVGRLSAVWQKGKIFGIDISLAVLQKGKRIFPQTNFIQGDLREIEFIRHESIDNAIAIEVIEHLDKPANFLQGLNHIMKAGGILLITAPGYSHLRPKLVSLGAIRSFGITEGTSGKLYLHTAFKPDELSRMAEQAGFEVIEQGSFEYELRGWVKPLTTATSLFEQFASRCLPQSRLNYLFMKFIHSLEMNTFFILETFSFSKFLKKIFREGRRSYILATK